jgi:hypothetical protein
MGRRNWLENANERKCSRLDRYTHSQEVGKRAGKSKPPSHLSPDNEQGETPVYCQ